MPNHPRPHPSPAPSSRHPAARHRRQSGILHQRDLGAAPELLLNTGYWGGAEVVCRLLVTPTDVYVLEFPKDANIYM